LGWLGSGGRLVRARDIQLCWGPVPGTASQGWAAGTPHSNPGPKKAAASRGWVGVLALARVYIGDTPGAGNQSRAPPPPPAPCRAPCVIIPGAAPRLLQAFYPRAALDRPTRAGMCRAGAGSARRCRQRSRCPCGRRKPGPRRQARRRQARRRRKARACHRRASPERAVQETQDSSSCANLLDLVCTGPPSRQLLQAVLWWWGKRGAGNACAPK
jgi:hypothetical protein